MHAKKAKQYKIATFKSSIHINVHAISCAQHLRSKTPRSGKLQTHFSVQTIVLSSHSGQTAWQPLSCFLTLPDLWPHAAECLLPSLSGSRSIQEAAYEHLKASTVFVNDKTLPLGLRFLLSPFLLVEQSRLEASPCYVSQAENGMDNDAQVCRACFLQCDGN